MLFALVLVGALTLAASQDAAPSFDNEEYQFGLLTRGPNWTPEDTPEIRTLQEGHMANITRMAQAGKLFAAGPMADKGDLRGIFIFRASAEEARRLANQDPAIQAGRLALELHPWFGTKGIGVKAADMAARTPDMKWTMKVHHLVLLRRGPHATQPAAEAQRLQVEHLRHIKKLMDERRMLAAGPFTDDGELRGVFVLNTESGDEARAWAEADPAVKAGRLTVEIRPWFVATEVWPQG